MNLLLIFELLTFLFCYSSARAQKTVFCEYNNMANGRPGNSQYTTKDIDPNLCTHLVYSSAFLDIETNNNLITDWKLSNESSENYVGQRRKNPRLILLMDIQFRQSSSWNDTLIKLMANTKHINALVKNIVDFIRQTKFDGLSSYFLPTQKEKFGYMNFIRALKKVFQRYSFVLAVHGDKYQNSVNGYDIPILSSYVDFLVLTAYDFNEPSLQPNRADHPSPLYRRPWDTNNTNVDDAVKVWTSKGFPANKILLVIDLFGRSWTLSSKKISPPAPAFGPSPPGDTRGSGFMGYYEICQAVLNGGWKKFQYDKKRMGPYAVSPAGQNRTWVGYEDPAMAVTKSKYIISKGLGGAAVWDIGLDDYLNKCRSGHNPMLKAIYNTLFKR